MANLSEKDLFVSNLEDYNIAFCFYEEKDTFSNHANKITSLKFFGEITYPFTEHLSTKINEIKTYKIPHIKMSKRNIAQVKIIYREIFPDRLFDYFSNDLLINFGIAIDYSMINTDDYLKYHNPKREENVIFKILQCFEGVCETYDSDKWFPCFGFGGILSNIRGVNHCFYLSKNNEPDISQMKNVMENYYSTIYGIEPGKVTQLGPLLKKIIQIVESYKQKTYHIFLIIIHKEMKDILDTADLLHETSKLPISIVFIGLMEKETDDFGMLSFFSTLIY